ncbi:unnamed protein product [Brugia pahangi]|uniref:Transposase n=1 Tax=Brugia pahangi TaxID=6280 RepID=A0A0N4TKK0_BRUPA|nr:unnamed protein product [Brugia pahangi]
MRKDVTMNVRNNLNIVERLQKQYASIELTERTAIEHKHVHLFVMLIALSVQVYMMRSLFEGNSRIGLILRKGRLND